MSIIKSYAKINWSLMITGIKDGFHMLNGIMETIDIFDVLDICVTKNTDIIVKYNNISTMENDLCKRAAKAFFDNSNIIGGVNISVTKNIPMQAGLGGGSSDCACVLWYLNKYYNNPIDNNTLLKIGETLGADVPFFLSGGGCSFASGKGEVLKKIDKTKQTSLVLIKPFDGISTKQAFEICDSMPNKKIININDLANGLILNDKNIISKHMINHLEQPSITLLPKLQTIIDKLYSIGAKKAMMTGSGSTIIAIFDKDNIDLTCFDDCYKKNVFTTFNSFEITLDN